MKVAILGFGKQGHSALGYWDRPGNEITVCDINIGLELSAGVKNQLGADYLKNLDQFDLIIRSPAIHPKDIVEANSEAILAKVTSVTNEFFRNCPTRNIIGVTGTKGKGTTSTLIAKMLETAGKKVHLGGNIGTPPLELLKNNIQPEDWVVLELANYQLIDLGYSPKVAVCVMVAPEHLDWHSSLDEYFMAKKQLFSHQKAEDIAVYYAKNDYCRDIASASPGKIIPYFQPPGAIVENDDIIIDGQSICSTDEIKLLGQHNWQNICGAITAVWQVHQNVEAIRKVISTFSGLKHRLELIRELDGVRYYDDSFGTTPETAKVAIEAFTEPKIIILGGRGKGVPLTLLGNVVSDNDVKNVIAIGETGESITNILRAAGYTRVVEGKNTIDEIVKQAQDLAKPGDVVLLSPACTSFDMFNNYAERGDKFKEAVLALS